jgi:hypothetical protein
MQCKSSEVRDSDKIPSYDTMCMSLDCRFFLIQLQDYEHVDML